MLVGLEPSMGVTFVLDPIVAREFVERGFDTKEKLAEWVHENARIPAGRYWDHIMLNMIREVVEGGIEPFASYRKAPPEELIPIFETNRINVVVAGGQTNGHFSIFMGSPMRAKFRSMPGRPSPSTRGARAMQDVEGKVAFITGGASGVGLGMAEGLLWCRDEGRLADIRQEHLDEAMASLGGGRPTRSRSTSPTAPGWLQPRRRPSASSGRSHVICNNAGITL